jgi:endonuclease YncB( thermonuclease family)
MARRLMRSLAMRTAAATALAAVLLVAQAVAAGERLVGPVAAEVIRVIDGDSLEVRAFLWIGLVLTVQVRVRGIDAPETGGRAKCASELSMGTAARDRLTALASGRVALANITPDKFGGRVDADVTNSAGVDLAGAMLASGLVRPYGGDRRSDWCKMARLGGN